ncbi:antibiotic biosynthesis monooxygenase [Streptacidiphilus griseoplanus]|uniref:antibiotic biosynthesis monooxygenase n=1 Tax=Peterkaempfera griseoplana TaxID=66896 RepID=UPI0006E3CC8B|nr:antibiotic biosynthesis monooxygenase [Peterkaempfera griseoplana]
MKGDASRGVPDESATAVLSQRVRADRVDDYRHWQDRTTEAARGFDGFEGTEVYPPHGAGGDWVVVFRFTRLDQLTAWLESPERSALLEEGRPLFETPPTHEVVAGESATQDVVTAVVSHRVLPGRERDFARWQSKIERVQERFPGYMGAESFEPVPGVQQNWVTVFRFDTRDHLDAWLDSEARKRLLEEGRRYVASFDVRKVGSSFGGWFRFGGDARAVLPPKWKQAMSVLLALYPTVMVLTLTVGGVLKDAGVPGYAALFISNILSVSILTWLLMPLVNRVLGFWLVPAGTAPRRVHIAGTAAVVACYALLLVVFGLTTHL